MNPSTLPQERTTSASSGPVLRVLIVEDDILLREVLLEFLAMHRLEVECAGDGMDAVDLATRKAYDVIVSDIHLPSMDGTGVARSVHALPRPPAVILITAYPDWWSSRVALPAGVERVLFKPFDLHALLRAVESASRGAQGDGRADLFREGSD